MFYFAFVHILYVSICLFFLASHATFGNAPSLWLQYDLRAWHCFKQIKQQNLDPASPLPLKCTQVKLLTQIMTSCSQLGLAQPWRWLLSSTAIHKKGCLGQSLPYSTHGNWNLPGFSLSGMKQKARPSLYYDLQPRNLMDQILILC